MKHLLLCLLLLLGAVPGRAAVDDEIQLPEPNLERPATLMQALLERRSTREFDARPLALTDLGDLLWAANGFNRPDEAKRTAPSALNRQDVDIYVLTATGAYRYEAAAHCLELVTDEDLRPAAAGLQTFAAQAPAVLLLVSDLERLGLPDAAAAARMGALDAGIVSQNVSLFCAAAGLATVPRGSMNADELARALGLGPKQVPMLNHPVGYPPSATAGQ